LVDLGAIEAGRLSIQPRPHPAGELVRATLSLLEPSASARSVRLAMESEASVPVLCDGQRIQQVLINLIGNAIQFSPEGAAVRGSVEARGGRVLFAVVDSGAGIAPEALPHIFDRYWQARRREGGVGLGLTIARGIVAAHGGALCAESELGRGSRFS